MTNRPVTDALKILLADLYTLYLKTQNYHWNVTGPNFKSLHELFQLQYEDLAAAVDEVAERIRALGEKAPGTFAEFSDLTNLVEAAGKESAEKMIKTLCDDHRKMGKTLARVLAAAQKAEDEGTVDLITGRMLAHDKHAWMLEASLT